MTDRRKVHALEKFLPTWVRMERVQRRIDLGVIEPVTSWNREEPLERLVVVAERRVCCCDDDWARERLSGGKALDHEPGFFLPAGTSIDSGNPPGVARLPPSSRLIGHQCVLVQAHLIVDVAKEQAGFNARLQFLLAIKPPQSLVHRP